MFLQRFAGGESRKAKMTLNRLRRDIIARLSQEPTDFQRNRLTMVMADIDKLYRNMGAEVSKQVKGAASGLVVDEAQFAAQTVSKVSSVDFIVPASDLLVNSVLLSRMNTNSRLSAKTIDEAIVQFAGKKAEQVNQLIADSLSLGDTTQQIQSKVRGLTGTLQKREMDTVVRTAINHSASVARREVYDRNADILDGYIWIATLDNKTCLYCGSKDQTKIDSLAGEFPTAHYNCRCTTVPNVKEEYSLRGFEGGRPSIGAKGVKSVESNKSYGAWLKKQPEEFVNEAIGVERSRLFRSGQLTLDKFTDPTGRVYTLQQLKNMNGIAAIDTTASVVKASQLAPAFVAQPAVIFKIKPSTVNYVTASNAKKEIEQRVISAASDSRYVLSPDGLPTVRFRPAKVPRGRLWSNVRREAIGKVSLDGLSPEAASILNATMADANAIANIYKVQGLRGATTNISGRAAMSMGDGVLNVSKSYVNEVAAGANQSKAAKTLADVTAKLVLAEQQYDKTTDIAKALKVKYQGGLIDRAEYFASVEQANKAIDKYNRLYKQKIAANKALEGTSQAVNTWKVGDDLTKRPWVTGSYFKDPIDQLRVTTYHETAHHVHQQFMVDSMARYKAPPLESLLDNLFRKGKAVSPTKYADSDSKEWFAENFALYHMGRDELVAPVLKDLLDSMAKGRYIDFTETYRDKY